MLLQWMVSRFQETPPEVVLHTLGQMSLQGAVLIAALLLLRGVFARRVTPVVLYALWLLPAVRLLVPVSVGSVFSFLNFLPGRGGALAEQTAECVSQDVPPLSGVTLTTGDPLLYGTIEQDVIAEASGTAETWSVPSVEPYMANGDVFAGTASYGAGVLVAVWLLGAAVVLALAVWRNASFLRRVERDAVELEVDCPLPVYLSESVSSPCLWGLFHPVILVNDAVVSSDVYLNMALRHELAHWRAGDRYWALLRLACCAVHWFNPLVWLAAAVSVQDCERACDHRVLKGADREEREQYGMALLRCLRAPGARYNLLCLSSTMGGGKRSLHRRIALIAVGVPVKRTAAAALAGCVALTCLVACTGRVDGGSSGKPELEKYQEMAEALRGNEQVAYARGGSSGTVSGITLAEYLGAVQWEETDLIGSGSDRIAVQFYPLEGDVFSGGDLSALQIVENESRDEEVYTGEYYAKIVQKDAVRAGETNYAVSHEDALAAIMLCALPGSLEGSGHRKIDAPDTPIQSIDWTSYPGGMTVMANTGVAMGRQEHYLFRTEDGGESYTYIPSDLNDVWSRVSEEFCFVSADVGFVSFRYEIDDPMLLRTGDGGRTWQRVALPMGDVTYENGYGGIHVTEIEFTDENNGRVTVSMNYKGTDLSSWFFTEDGGLTWGTVSTGLPQFVDPPEGAA